MTPTGSRISTLCFFLAGLISLSARAHIPSSQFILEQVAKNHGKGTYSLDQDVVIQSGTDTLSVTEHWLILSPNQMQLTVKGSNFRFSVLYLENQKYFLDESGAQKTAPTTIEFFEPYFLVRSSATLARYLTATGMVSASALQPKKTPINIKDLKFVPESNLRLTRMGGVPCLTFGEPTPAEATKANPALWIEQDRFVVRKIRLNTTAEIVADEYNEFARGFSFPRIRALSWDQNTARFSVRRLDGKNESDSMKKTFSPQSFFANKDLKPLAADAPALIKAFYSRFR